MKKIIFTTLFTSAAILSANNLQTTGLEVSYTNSEDVTKTVTIKREKPQECANITFKPDVIYGGDKQIEKSVNPKCKRAYITYAGKISPMKFSQKVETVGEVEVLDFIQKAKDNKNMLLVDTRTEDWFFHETIPSAINVPYRYLKKSQFPEEFEEYVELLGVTKVDGKYDFTNAKELLLFCNGVWCGQSPEAMKYLTAIGYPEEKLKWYRGGIQSWLSLGLQVVKP